MSDGRTRNTKTQAAIRKAKINRDKARRKLLKQRRRLAKRRKSNRERSERAKDKNSTDDNRNPTVKSLLPRQRTNAENATRNAHSSVPEKPKYSEVDPAPRLYGSRFNAERGSEDDSDE